MSIPYLCRSCTLHCSFQGWLLATLKANILLLSPLDTSCDHLLPNMIRRVLPLVVGVLGLCAFATADAQDDPHVFRGATVYSMSSGTIDDGALVIQNSEILDVGPTEAMNVPLRRCRD